ncbi:DUF3892 domain-containing protein [Actinokineospora bangkokensis]|uniref:DUF3892 domain-containing protein n=1 Tax=Actinokineospora bangkokensis TaxID=1193682 RepID=A0A1Q9LUB8_9PSEU|nr:DUF3892 domain-containing protein [Actinokineospora bangkokensis]OLR95574.1 hypothetical protein BJP25_00325 [Actinokineospora bangkokensis]
MAVHVTHVHMQEHGDEDHEHIDSVRGTDTVSGQTETYTVARMVSYIENGGEAYTEAEGRRATIYVRQNGGRKFIQTKADGVWSNNLLNLTRF